MKSYEAMQHITKTFSIANAPTHPQSALPKSEAKSQLKACIKRIKDLHERLQAEKRQSLLCIFQAMDAAGKDGTIRAVFSGLNPAGIQVTPFGRPTPAELARDYLWRVHQAVPPKGQIGVFNRSHYEEVVTVRVFPQFLEAQKLPKVELEVLMNQRLDDIRAFEKRLAQSGTRILKFFLHVGKAEQKKRLLSRMDTPEKHWKHDGHDLNCRARWDDFMAAYQTALRDTSSEEAPWFCVPADHKPTMRLMVALKIQETLMGMTPQFPSVDGKSIAEIQADKARLLSMDRS